MIRRRKEALNKVAVMAQINKGIEDARAWAHRLGVDVRIWDVYHVDILPSSTKEPKGAPWP